MVEDRQFGSLKWSFWIDDVDLTEMCDLYIKTPIISLLFPIEDWMSSWKWRQYFQISFTVSSRYDFKSYFFNQINLVLIRGEQFYRAVSLVKAPWKFLILHNLSDWLNEPNLQKMIPTCKKMNSTLRKWT